MRSKKAGIFFAAGFHAVKDPLNAACKTVKPAVVFWKTQYVMPHTFHSRGDQIGFGTKIVVDGAHRNAASRRHGPDIKSGPSPRCDQFSADI